MASPRSAASASPIFHRPGGISPLAESRAAARGPLRPWWVRDTTPRESPPHPTSYSASRFGRLEPLPAPPGGQPEGRPNPVISRLERELARVSRVTGHPALRDAGEAGQGALPRTREAWAVVWRRWAIEDLGDSVEQSRRTYVIHRGEVFLHRLFLGRGGRQLLAVQPQHPVSPLRYEKLRDGMTLEELYGPFARLSDSPRG